MWHLCVALAAPALPPQRASGDRRGEQGQGLAVRVFLRRRGARTRRHFSLGGCGRPMPPECPLRAPGPLSGPPSCRTVGPAPGPEFSLPLSTQLRPQQDAALACLATVSPRGGRLLLGGFPVFIRVDNAFPRDEQCRVSGQEAVSSDRLPGPGGCGRGAAAGAGPGVACGLEAELGSAGLRRPGPSADPLLCSRDAVLSQPRGPSSAHAPALLLGQSLALSQGPQDP